MVAALEKSLPAVERQIPPGLARLARMAEITAIDQHGADLSFEQFNTAVVRPGGPTAAMTTIDSENLLICPK